VSTATTSHGLSDAEITAMNEDGYVVRERVFDADECADITAHCEALTASLVSDRQAKRYHVGSYSFDPDQLTGCTIKWEGDSDVVHGLEPFAHLAPELERVAYDARFVEPSIPFIADEQPMLFTEKLNLKRPFHGGPNPWHQDWPYWQFADDPTRIVTAMLFLDDATLENGTLEVLPGSHKRGPWPTRTDRDDFGNLELDPTYVEGHTPVALEVPAGTVVWFGPLLVHKSEPNRSAKERRTLLYSYQPKGFEHSREIDLRRAEERIKRRAAREATS
jgi:ectoine hydroxylase-related dioxygenase (phytanoyl-CoA dioxygenase family)